MTALEYILDGLEAELALERELGVRFMEFDRSLLAGPAGGTRSVAPEKASGPGGRSTLDVGQRPRTLDKGPSVAAATEVGPPGGVPSSRFDFVFLHDRPLSPKAVEMMAKIITAMGKTAETAPVVIAPPRPAAKAYVVLGGLALRKFFPGVKAEPGQWITGEQGEAALVTYSPEYILRFGTVTPAVKKLKQDMWTSLKAVVQRTRFS